MPSHKLDFLRGTSMTRGVQSRGRDRATRVGEVTELTVGSRDQLDEAIDHLEAQVAATHPDDSSLELATISVRQIQDRDTVAATLRYRRPTTRVDLSREAKDQTSRYAGSMSVEWWRDASAFDSFGMPNGFVTFRPYNLNDNNVALQPRSYSYTVGVVTIELPTLLSNPPAIQHAQKIGRLNSNNDTQFLSTGGFPPESLRFDGWQQAYIGSGKWLVIYKATYMQERWPYMTEPWYDPDDDAWRTAVFASHPSTNLAGLPVHTPIE